MTSHGATTDWSPGSMGAGEATGMEKQSNHSLSIAADDDFLSMASSSNAAPSPAKAFRTAITGVVGRKSASHIQISGNATARNVSMSPAAITPNAKSNAEELVVQNAVSKKCYDIFNHNHALFEDLM